MKSTWDLKFTPHPLTPPPASPGLPLIETLARCRPSWWGSGRPSKRKRSDRRSSCRTGGGKQTNHDWNMWVAGLSPRGWEPTSWLCSAWLGGEILAAHPRHPPPYQCLLRGAGGRSQQPARGGLLLLQAKWGEAGPACSPLQVTIVMSLIGSVVPKAFGFIEMLEAYHPRKVGM